MESHIDDTTPGIFDSDSAPPELLGRTINLKELRRLQQIELVDEKRVDWYFLKHCDDPRMKVIVVFAEDWARCMQLFRSEGYTIQECWAVSANIVCRNTLSRAMAHRAFTILFGIWPSGEELRESHEEYWRNIGAAKEREQIEQLEDHLY